MKKRTWALGIVAAFLIGACGGDDDTEADDVVTESTVGDLLTIEAS
jgi:hypothetical protein